MMRSRRILPGIQFSVDVPERIDLPRMDVAGFVGFAESGPCHIPVVIEDTARFRAIFGETQRLAWDTTNSRWQTTQLAAAVEDFFAQGGTRCWVVRVTGEAETNLYPIAGLLEYDTRAYRPAAARARSAGSWSDSLQIGANMLFQLVTSLTADCPVQERLTFEVRTPLDTTLQPGDILHLEFDKAITAYAVIVQLEPLPTSTRGTRDIRVTAQAHWFTELAIDDSIPDQNINGACEWLRNHAPNMPLPFNQLQVSAPDISLQFEGNAETAITRSEAEELQQLQCGDWVHFAGSEADFFLLVQHVDMTPLENPNDVLLSLAVEQGWRIGTSIAGPLPIKRMRLVKLVLQSQCNEEIRSSLGDLAFSAPHPRFWGYLNTDDDYFRRYDDLPQPLTPHPAAALRQYAAEQRFPFAALANADTQVFIPLGLHQPDTRWHPAYPARSPETALVRDGYFPDTASYQSLSAARWGEHLQAIFLDEYMARSSQVSLLNDAFDRRFLQGTALRGFYSLLPIDEISMIALPDLTQPGWTMTLPPAPIPPEVKIEKVEPCQHEGYLFQHKPPPQEDDGPAAEPSNPSIAIALNQQYELGWETRRGFFPEDALLAVHQRLVELSAARANMVAILSLPNGYLAKDVITYQDALLLRLYRSGTTTDSYAALYYPNLLQREDDGSLQAYVPDGAACGMIAQRSRLRGAWVAPANDVLVKTLGLTQQISLNTQDELYQLGINVIKPSARGYIISGAHTLSDDEEWMALNVRRLFILLRRIVLREGDRYVFEMQSAEFRRRVKQSMESILSDLFARGAFAGETTSQSFRVIVDDSVNPPVSVMQGRFIVELRIAPSQPLVFITVRLVETGGKLTVVEG